MAKQKRRHYDDKFRASAVVMLEAAGYPNKTGALTEVAAHLGISHQLLSNWARATHNPVPQDVLQEEKTALADLFEGAARIYLKHGTDPVVVAEVSGQASMTAAAIAVDKMQLLRGLPTEIVGMLPELMAALAVLGQDPKDVFNRIIQRAAQEANAKSADG